jgi:1,4-dihydroxy-2-naphthoate octaprenyltransferase
MVVCAGSKKDWHLFIAAAVLGYSYYGKGLKYLGFGEIIAFFSFGPMLTYGFSRAAGFYHSKEVIFLGFGFGILATLTIFSRQLENIVDDSLMGIKTLSVKIGFDKSKKLFEFILFVLPLIYFITIYFLIKSRLALLTLIPFSYFVFKQYLLFQTVNSSYSSGIVGLRHRIADLHILYSTLLLLSLGLQEY